MIIDDLMPFIENYHSFSQKKALYLTISLQSTAISQPGRWQSPSKNMGPAAHLQCDKVELIKMHFKN